MSWRNRTTTLCSSRNPKTFLVMGTSQKVNQCPFETETVTLAEAIARAGGGTDATSNLAGVYLFRYEPGNFARTLMTADSQAVDSSYVKSRIGALDGGADAPVIYRLDLTQADGYFFAQQVQLRDKDQTLDRRQPVQATSGLIRVEERAQDIAAPASRRGRAGQDGGWPHRCRFRRIGPTRRLSAQHCIDRPRR